MKTSNRISRYLVALLFIFICSFTIMAAEPQSGFPGNYAKAPRFKALLCYSETAEPAHVEFGRQAVEFFRDLTVGDGFILDIHNDFKDLDYDSLARYDVVIAINTAPASEGERKAFERYMENGGGWIGFHAAGYNDERLGWPWFNEFLGAGTFLCNSWPPQPALLDVNIADHPVTKNLPASFVAPKNEWYMWNDAPDTRGNVDVLISVSPNNFPIGLKDVVSFGKYPVVWTNRDYRMIYLNFGHGDREFSDATQNLLIINVLRWIVSRSPKGDPFRITSSQK